MASENSFRKALSPLLDVARQESTLAYKLVQLAIEEFVTDAATPDEFLYAVARILNLQQHTALFANLKQQIDEIHIIKCREKVLIPRDLATLFCTLRKASRDIHLHRKVLCAIQELLRNKNAVNFIQTINALFADTMINPTFLPELEKLVSAIH